MSTKLKVDKIDFAFQAIVNIYTGKLFGVEALLRNNEVLGFNTINELFDYCCEQKNLLNYDLKLLKKALDKYKTLNIDNIKFFYNIDNRLTQNKEFDANFYDELTNVISYKNNNICFELTKQHTDEDIHLANKLIPAFKEFEYKLAIDNFGSFTTDLSLLYLDQTDYVKIDRYFIQNMKTTPKKRIFCSTIIDLAHTMNKKVIALGVETIEEYYICKELKFDFIQGFLVAAPTTNINEIQKRYPHIKELAKSDKRGIYDNIIDKSYIDKIEPLSINTTLHDLFTYFKKNRYNTFVPILDEDKKILGAIYEVDIKGISYSQYGLSLAQNSSYKSKLKTFIEPVIQIDITWGIDKALQLFSMQSDSKGIFVTKNDKYFGFINLNNLLSLSYKRNIEIAENKNPLTKLPGNNQIEKFLENIFESQLDAQVIYFDFNDFKPFNDQYGFRQGDRAILMFSEILQKNIMKDGFVAHVGGDDFVVIFVKKDYEETYALVSAIQEEFKNSARALYNETDIKNDFMMAKDRFGTNRKFKLLSVCSAIIELVSTSTTQTFNEQLGGIKKMSKQVEFPLGTTIIM